MDLGQPKESAKHETPDGQTRRNFLRLTGGVTAGSIAGCSSVIGGSSLDTLSVAYKPIFPFLQFLVMDERGYLDELDANVETTDFANQGLNIVSAYSDGDIDVAFIGITPAIRMKHQGVPGKVTAANQTGGFVVLATDEFVDLWNDHGADAFEAFREQEGRPFQFSTFPKGSVAYVLLRHWLDEELGVGTDPIEIENVAGVGPVRQALLSGNADGTFVMEPLPTILEARDAPFSRVTNTGSFLSGAPGGITFMHDRLVDDHPDVARAFLRQHVRATELINEDSGAAAEAVSAALGDRLSADLSRRAIESSASNYISDPRAISEGTQVCIQRMQDLGQISDPVETNTILEPSIYQDVTE
ncbi:ABC transporter substrate-binding protein [Haloarcula rubripromontorii]|uniref:ABC transporter substrate-binding protein n=1 Tax=Haloarcula rubripromontorii TaxID=1705562 RepID=UPI00345BE270